METFSRKQSVEEYASLSNAAAKGYGTTRFQRGFKTASFKDFRAAARKSHEEWTQKRENYEKEVQKLKETFLPSVANPRINELRNAYEKERSAEVDRLREQLGEVIADKHQAMEEYCMKPAPNDTLKLLQGYSMRGKVGFDELKMLLAKCGSSYQSLAVAQKIAEDSGFQFTMPLNISEFEQDLNVLQQTTSTAIATGLDTDDGYTGRLFFAPEGFYEKNPFDIDFAANDNSVDLMTGSEANVIDTLAAIRDVAHEAAAEHKESGDYAAASKARNAANEIQNFINQRGSDLLTPEEKAEYKRNEAIRDAGEMLNGLEVG